MDLFPFPWKQEEECQLSPGVFDCRAHASHFPSLDQQTKMLTCSPTLQTPFQWQLVLGLGAPPPALVPA